MALWGVGPWGSGPWGGSLSSDGAPQIIPLSPIANAVGVAQAAPISIRYIDDDGVNPASISVIIGGTAWMVGGVGLNGAIATLSANVFNGYDLELRLPVPFDNGSVQTVQTFAANVGAVSASLQYIFSVGAGLRLLQVRNAMPNVLLAYFNRGVRLDAPYYQTSNWIVTPLTATKPLTVTEVLARAGRADISYLRYTGGGPGTYRLRVRALTSEDGSGIDTGYDVADFTLAYPDEEEPNIKLFDSIFGPLGISQQIVQRRTMDGHVADRALATALNEQLRIRVERSDTTLSRKPGRGRL